MIDKTKIFIISSLSCVLILLVVAIIIVSIQFGKVNKELADIKTSFSSYKNDVLTVAQQSLELERKFNEEKNKNDELRSLVDNGFTSLSVSISRYSTAVGKVVEETAQLSRDVRHNYFNLRQQLKDHELMIDGWQDYYCRVIAPKNNTLSLCSEINNQ